MYFVLLVFVLCFLCLDIIDYCILIVSLCDCHTHSLKATYLLTLYRLLCPRLPGEMGVGTKGDGPFSSVQTERCRWYRRALTEAARTSAACAEA